MYMEQDELLKLLDVEPQGCIVIDVRDDDNAGGQIKGAHHCPDSTFDAASVSALLTGAAPLRGRLEACGGGWIQIERAAAAPGAERWRRPLDPAVLAHAVGAGL
jgi:rhodanese-related sulfurtransferase